MKKIIVLVFALVAFSRMANAQAEVALGIKGGPNFASLNANSSAQANYDSHTGFHAGAFMLFKFGKIGLQPEVLFSEQGSKVSPPGATPSNPQSYTSNFNYVNVPIVIKLYTVAGINIQFGPQFGFLTNSPTYKEVSAGNGQVTSYNNYYKKSDVSAALGLGWDLPFGLSIDARYNLGLTKIQANNNPDKTTNQVIQISLGYKLIKFGK
jgi:Outer membrane protein beta-barrel domain